MKKQLFAYVLMTLVVAITALCVTLHSHPFTNSVFSPSSSPLTVSPSADVNSSKGTAYNDDHVLVGIKHDVFVGKVLRELGRKNIKTDAGTQFEVRPILNIKGNLKDSIVVFQFDFTLNETNPVLHPGSTYIFATRYYQDDDVYVVSGSQYTYALLTDDASMTDATLKALAMDSERVRALQAAYPTEVLQESDIKLGITYNSYASRKYDAKGELIDDTVVLSQAMKAGASPSPVVSEPASEPPSISPSSAPTEETVSPSPTLEPTATSEPSATPEPSLTPTPSATPATSSTSQPFTPPESPTTSVVTATSAQ